MRTRYWTALRDDGETEIEVEYTATPVIPARTYGLPEDCYPAEGGEVDIVCAWYVPDPTGAATAVECELTDAEAERIATEIAEKLPEEDDDYPEDW